MAPPRRWIRLDVGWSDSDWVGALEPAARLAWIELLTYVKRDGATGSAKALTPAAFGRKARIPAEDVAAMLEAAKADGALIEQDGGWTIAKWAEFQEVDRTAAERMRRHRADKSRLSPLRRDDRHTPSQPVTGGVTRRVTETETETEQKTDARAQRVEPCEEFEQLWRDRPRRDGGDPKKRARQAWNARRREGIAPDVILAAHTRYRKHCEAEQKIGTPYVMQAATFLGDPENFANEWSSNGNGGGKPKTARFDYSAAAQTKFTGFTP